MHLVRARGDCGGMVTPIVGLTRFTATANATAAVPRSTDRPMSNASLNADRLTSEDRAMGDVLEQRLDDLCDRLRRIESAVSTLVEQRTVKEWYTTEEVAAVLGRRPFTVREWCRLGRIHAEKRETGRGNTLEWSVSHDELERIRNYGLLPAPSYRHVR